MSIKLKFTESLKGLKSKKGKCCCLPCFEFERKRPFKARKLFYLWTKLRWYVHEQCKNNQKINVKIETDNRNRVHPGNRRW